MGQKATEPASDAAWGYPSDCELEVTRVFDAPRELVWKAWTDPDHVGAWWGPNGFTTTTSSMDVRPGGAWRFVMRGPDGKAYDNLVVYREVQAPHRLAYWHGEKEGDPHAFEVVVTFAEEDGKTRVSLRQTYPSKEARDFVVKEFGAVEGGMQTLARLAEHLKHMQRS